MKFRKITCSLAVGLACVFLTGCVTIKVSPAWEVTNVDRDGRPVTKGLRGSQVWGYHGLTFVRVNGRSVDTEGLIKLSAKKLTPDVARFVLAHIIVLVLPSHSGKEFGKYGEELFVSSHVLEGQVRLDPTDKKLDKEFSQVDLIWKVDVDDDGVARCTLVWETDKNGKPTKVIKIIQAERVEIEK